MANKFMKQYPTSFVIREMQIETMMRSQSHPQKSLVKTKTTQLTMACAGDNGEHSTYCCILGEMQSIQPFGKQFGSFF